MFFNALSIKTTIGATDLIKCYFSWMDNTTNNQCNFEVETPI